VTGLTVIVGTALGAKRLQLFKEAVPKISRVAVLNSQGGPGIVPGGVGALDEAARSPCSCATVPVASSQVPTAAPTGTGCTSPPYGLRRPKGGRGSGALAALPRVQPCSIYY
jgi:hypothetical protein